MGYKIPYTVLYGDLYNILFDVAHAKFFDASISTPSITQNYYSHLINCANLWMKNEHISAMLKLISDWLSMM